MRCWKRRCRELLVALTTRIGGGPDEAKDYNKDYKGGSETEANMEVFDEKAMARQSFQLRTSKKLTSSPHVPTQGGSLPKSKSIKNIRKKYSGGGDDGGCSGGGGDGSGGFYLLHLLKAETSGCVSQPDWPTVICEA
ncbi:hypothetical protein Tco_0478210 [Tanacetum coccineum]